MKNKMNVSFEITANVEYVTFDGTNIDEVIGLISKYGLHSSDEVWYEVRPDDVPNLDYVELVKWWEATGEIKHDHTRNYDYNTHNMNNLPKWRKDEMFCTNMRSKMNGYMHPVFWGKYDTLVVYELNGTYGTYHYFQTTATEEEEIREEVINAICERAETF